jgi:hypothetical protein
MKYLTKEWYHLSQNTHMDILLESSIEVEQFSHDYFVELYTQKFAKWLSHQFVIGSDDDGGMPVISLRESIAGLKNIFDESLRNNICQLNEKLPEEIRSKVADIRVLALGVAAPGVYDDIKGFCKANMRKVKRASNNYGKYYRKLLKKEHNGWVAKFNFHDYIINNVKEEHSDFSIYFNNSSGSTPFEKVTFEGFRILLKESEPLLGAIWLYDEIYIVNNGYEIHILLKSIRSSLFYLTIYAKNIIYCK